MIYELFAIKRALMLPDSLCKVCLQRINICCKKMTTKQPPQSYLALQMQLLKFGGMRPLFEPISGKPFHNFLAHLHIYVLFLNLIHMAVSQIISISIKWNGSVMEISPYLLETIVALTGMGFQLTTYLNQDEFETLFLHFNSHIKYRSIPGISRVTMDRPYNISRKFTLLWMCMSVGATAHYALNPILDRERRLPIPVVYPFDVMQSPYYEIEYALQALAQLHYGFAFSIVIGMVSSVSIMLCGQLDVLYCGIHNLLYSAMLRRGDPVSLGMVARLQQNWALVNLDKIRYYYAVEEMDDDAECEDRTIPDSVPTVTDIRQLVKYRDYDEEVTEVLKGLIKHHQFIIETARAIEKSFRQIFFLELFEHTFYTCIITYAMTMHDRVDNTFIHMVYYFLIVNLDTFLMCYTPHLLAEQSVELVDAIFKSPFYLYGPKVQQHLLFMILSCKKDLHMTCWKIFRVDLTTSFKIVKGAFSYFMLLKNLHDKND